MEKNHVKSGSQSSLLTLSEISKTYSHATVLEPISLSIYPGESLGILGPNGAGKSTLLHCMTQILEPTSGHLTLNDGVTVGFAPDDLPMPDLLTGLEYLQYVAGLQRIRLTHANAELLARNFDLQDSLSRLVSTYSHGMRRKLSLLGALLSDPNVLVLDEPLRGLDPETSVVVKSLMQAFTESGRAIVISTHDLHIAEKLCDRVLILSDGRMKVYSNIDELLSTSDGDLEQAFLDITGIRENAETACQATLKIVKNLTDQS